MIVRNVTIEIFAIREYSRCKVAVAMVARCIAAHLRYRLDSGRELLLRVVVPVLRSSPAAFAASAASASAAWIQTGHWSLPLVQSFGRKLLCAPLGCRDTCYRIMRI